MAQSNQSYVFQLLTQTYCVNLIAEQGLDLLWSHWKVYSLLWQILKRCKQILKMGVSAQAAVVHLIIPESWHAMTGLNWELLAVSFSFPCWWRVMTVTHAVASKLNWELLAGCFRAMWNVQPSRSISWNWLFPKILTSGSKHYKALCSQSECQKFPIFSSHQPTRVPVWIKGAWQFCFS